MVLMTSGLTASISLIEVAKIKKGQTVLVRHISVLLSKYIVSKCSFLT